MRVTEGTIAAYVYEDGVGFLGLADIDMPDVNFKTFEMSGLGMCGSANYGALCQFEPMTSKLNFRDTSEAYYVLSDQRMHMLTLEVAKQDHDYQAGEIPVTGIKYIMQFEPIKRTGGNVAPATPQKTSVEGSVFMLKEFVNGKLEQHIDVINYIYIGHDGVDRAAPIRKALNMPN